ncbi:MAG TPA: UDP-N-acetylmuramate--L-alanine ligase [Anaerolineales bacterium]|nr:UDP-N-acetylmuramate--L-alanine ligase [Anaerolineales bacterium]
MKRVHLIGIGGSGLSAIATLLLESGAAVSGSDAQASAMTDKLQSLGAIVSIGHRAENVAGVDVVVVSSAVAADNPEVAAAKAAGIPVMKRADFLGELMTGRTAVCVAGTHGKTTTTALIAYMLLHADRDPSFIVGGMMADLGTNARHGQGEPFVIEADEYDGMFLGLRPKVAVVTNVEHDHPDYYPTAEDYKAAFSKFVALVPGEGVLIVCRDDPGAKEIGEIAAQSGKHVLWYGLKNGSEWKAEHIQANGAGGNDFVATRNGVTVGLVRIRLPGVHNVSNSLAALAAVDALGVDFNVARTALSEFQGVGRRFEIKGEANGVTVVDDYAHHPTEIRATLAAARRRYAGRQVWAMFQPHTFSRTRALLNEFAASFGDADHVLVTDIYRSREAVDETVSAKQIVAQMRHPDARYVPALTDAIKTLLAEVKPGDVLITLGAGDGNMVGEKVLEALKRNEEDQGKPQISEAPAG